jgi:hypothetical protein
MRIEKMDVWVPENSPVWSDSNFVQVIITRGKLPAFDWALFIHEVREILTQVKGSRSKITEVDGKGGEFLAPPEPTRVFMVTFPLLTRGSVERLRKGLETLDYGDVVLMFGTSILV